MAWGARWYLVGCVILGILGVLAGCSGGSMFAEREPWRREAEAQCINSGVVKEGAGIVRITAIRGPGMCGADLPLRVSVLIENSALGYSDDLRPPGTIPAGSAQPRWPGNAPPAYEPRPLPYPSRSAPPTSRAAPAAPRQSDANGPISLNPPGVGNP